MKNIEIKGAEKTLKIRKKLSLIESLISKKNEWIKKLSNRKHDKKREIRSKSKVSKILLLSITIFLSFVLISAVILSLIFLRYRQLCQYSKLIDNGTVTSNNNTNFCPNILEKSEWGKIALNSTNFNILSSIKINSQSNPDAVIANGQCDANTDPICWLKQLKGDLKQTNGFTNVLLVGTDSRNKNDITGNTDSLIVASFDNTSGKLFLISFPRDLFVKFTSPNGFKGYDRINALFAFYGRDTLKNSISDIIGRPIHYSIYLNYQTFASLIDALGGIDINLDKPFLNAYPRPDVKSAGKKCNPADFAPDGFCIFTFPKGMNHFSSFDALVYTRSRELTTDWDRAGRQQEVIRALLKNALAKNGSLQDKFNTYVGLYNNFTNNIYTDITIGDIGAMFKFADKISDEPARVVLEPQLEDGKFVFEYGNLEGFGDVSKFNDYSYNSIHQYLNKIWNNLPYYLENPKILIINASQQPIKKGSSLDNFISSKVPYASIQQKDQPNLNIVGLRIYDFSNGAKKGTLNDIQKKLPDALLYNQEIDGVTQSSFGENILIVYGK